MLNRILRTPRFAKRGSDNEGCAIHAGAHDCLNKGELGSATLSRSIAYGIERSKLLWNLQDLIKHSDTEVELDSLTSICAPAPLSEGSRGQKSLREAVPGIFADLVRRHSEYLESSLEERVMKTNEGVADGLKIFAHPMGILGAGPRDIVELHKTAMTSKLKGQPIKKAKATVVESRLVLLKLMGDLATFYRNLS